MSTVLNHHARRRALRDLRPRAGHSGRLPAPRRARCHRVQLIPGAGGEWLVSNTHLLVDCFWALQLKIRMFPAHTELLIAEERACCFSELTASGDWERVSLRLQTSASLFSFLSAFIAKPFSDPGNSKKVKRDVGFYCLLF